MERKAKSEERRRKKKEWGEREWKDGSEENKSYLLGKVFLDCLVLWR